MRTCTGCDSQYCKSPTDLPSAACKVVLRMTRGFFTNPLWSMGEANAISSWCSQPAQLRSFSRIHKPTGFMVNAMRSRAGWPSGVSTAKMSKLDNRVAMASFISSRAR